MIGICLYGFLDREISQVKIKKAQGWERVWQTTFEERWLARDETRKKGLANEGLEYQRYHFPCSINLLLLFLAFILFSCKTYHKTRKVPNIQM